MMKNRNIQEDDFYVSLDAYEGPLATLLELAREHQVDLKEISMVTLADQYLAFLGRQDLKNLTIAADYLVMAAWLTWLKARLIAPHGAEDAIETDPIFEAEQLRNRLIHLDKIRDSVQWLTQRPQLGVDFFAPVHNDDAQAEWVVQLHLHELLAAYRHMQEEDEIEDETLILAPPNFMPVKEAIRRLEDMTGSVFDFVSIAQLTSHKMGLPLRHVLIPLLLAALHLVRMERLTLSQESMDASLTLTKSTSKKVRA